MSDRDHDTLAWMGYLILMIFGIVIWFAVIIPGGEDIPLIVRLAAPAWWVLTTAMTSHYYRKILDRQ